MTRQLYILFLALMFPICCCGYTSNSYNAYRIGHTTSYGYGFNNSSSIDRCVESTYYRNYNTYYGNPYNGYGSNNTSGTGSKSKGGIRKIQVYNGQGDTEETPGGSSDNPEWLYEYDETTGEWWCSQDGGLTWKKWDSLWGWGIIGYAWRPGRGDPTEDAVHYHNDPNSPWLTPIGDGTLITLILILLYTGYTMIRPKVKKYFYVEYLNVFVVLVC